MKPRRTRVKRTTRYSMNCENGSRRTGGRSKMNRSKNRAKPRRKTYKRYGGTHEDMNARQFEYTTTFLPTN